MEGSGPGDELMPSSAVVFGRDLTVFQSRYRIMSVSNFMMGVSFSCVTVRI